MAPFTKPDVNVQPAVLGCKSEVRESFLESRQVLMYLGDGGRTVREEDPGHHFKRVAVPSLFHARLFEHVREIARRLGIGELLQSLRQVLPGRADKAPFVR